ncbi:MAG TPA: phytanoyl-CoA dioxygenase family protein, partial [Noviherbaspirillum sp.]
MTLPITDLYESRVERDAAIITRREPVVYRDEPYAAPQPLSEEELASYEREGFLFLPGFFSAREVAVLLAEVGAMAKDSALAGRDELIVEPESRAVRSIFMVHKLNKLMGNLARDARLAGVAQQILGSDVYIHQSRVNIKPEFEGKEFYWHSDFETWHVEDGMPEMRALSCSILLTDNNAVNGPLMLIPGSHSYFISCVGQTPDEHYKQSLRRQEYGVPDRDSLRMLTANAGIRAIEG